MCEHPLGPERHSPPSAEFSIEPAHPIEAVVRRGPNPWRDQAAYESMCRLRWSGSTCDAFRQCGSSAWVRYSPSSDRCEVQSESCRSRWCSRCSRDKGSRFSRNLAAWAEGRPLRLITLTLRHNQTGLDAQLKRLRSSYASLRRHPVWKPVKGTVSVVEVKLSKAGLWHPHLHILAIGDWVCQAALGAAWHGITGDSFVVDIRWIGKSREAVSYVAKYVGKPCDDSIYRSEDSLDEAMTALRGSRQWSTTGCCRGLDLDAVPADEPSDWIACGRLLDLIRDFQSGRISIGPLYTFLENLCRDSRLPP